MPTDMSQNVIQVENLSKRYKIGVSTGDASLRSRMARAARGIMRSSPEADSERPDIFYALRDVSFSVAPGEVMGVIGHNGAGKSTLLKILSRIVEPTRGRVEIHGRVGSLLEVGTGFHPELTGRENIFLNGAILGMQRVEIERKFDEIVAFAEVERFIDTPVKRYSSGMYVRLAFAVAAHLEPEILIVDEVLAVGDIAFQRKCLGKMGDVAREGRTILFVSHNMAVLRRLCPKSLWLSRGEVLACGDTNDILPRYLLSNESSLDGEYCAPLNEPPQEHEKVRVRRLSVRNHLGDVTGVVGTEGETIIEIEYEVTRTLEDFRIGYRLINSDGLVVFASTNTDAYEHTIITEPGIYIASCAVPPDLLTAGQYYLTICSDIPMREMLVLMEKLVSFRVEITGGIGSQFSDSRPGVIRPHLNWITEEATAGIRRA
jgi:lipopolysaccharide transport system ATP-binding protein